MAKNEHVVLRAAILACLCVGMLQVIVYGLLGARLSVQDVIDRSNLGEFESCKALYELLEKDLIQEVTPGVRAGDPPRPSRGVAMSGRFVPCLEETQR